MAKVQLFSTFSAAVRYALENTDIGTCSSLKELADIAYDYYDGSYVLSCEEQVASQVRSKYRKEKGLNEDARTYETQHRRNMLSDVKMPRCKWDEVQDILADMPIDCLSKLLSKFHSIEQARIAVETYQKTAEFVTLG